MSASNFFKATEDHSEYHDVCDIKRGNRTNRNVLDALSGLKCEGKELHQWTSQKKEFQEKFKRGKQCLERRLSTMKRFPARSEKNKTSRRKHIYPIQVAYTYGKDCLKKFATKDEQETFTNSVNQLIDSISEKRPNVRGYFGNSIENSIRGRKDIPDIQELLNRAYYNNNQTELINKARKVGNNEAKLSPNNREKYTSLFNEGFSRGNMAARAAALEEANESDSSSDSENEELSASAAPKLRRRKKKVKSLKSLSKLAVNTANNNKALATISGPNNAALEAEIIKRMEKLEKLYAEKSLIDEKLFYIEDIYYSAFSTINKVNKNVIEKENSMRNLGIKAMAKKLASNEKYMEAVTAVKQRTEIRESIEKVHLTLKEKLSKINKEIDELLESDNKTIKEVINNYYIVQLPKDLLKKTDITIDELSEEDYKKYSEEFNQLSKIKEHFEVINTELLEIETKINMNQLRQAKSKEMISSKLFKNRPELIEGAKKKLEELKGEEAELYKQLMKLYKKKTDKIYDILQQVNTKYQNPLVLIQNLETQMIRSLSKMLLGI